MQTTKPKANPTVLALYPTTYGIAYALFDAQDHLVISGIGTVRPVNNSKTVKKVQKYLDFYRPDIVLIRKVTPTRERKSRRTVELINLICQLARFKNLEVHQYTRAEIKGVFANFGAGTKFQIAKKLSGWFPSLEKFMYPEPKQWMGEHHYTGVFDAVSLGMTHFYLGE